MSRWRSGRSSRLSWLFHKLDSLIGAVFASLGGAGFSQLQAFFHQYLQRLGGHVDEARRSLQDVTTNPAFSELGEAQRQAVATVAQARLADLEMSYRSIRDSSDVVRPYEFARHLDMDIARAALTDFQPAVPLDVVSLGYAAVGLVLGLIVYDLIKLPCGWIFRGRDRQRGGMRRM
jgi:hypothetical protein